MRLRGNDNFFLLSRKKGTRNLLFAYVGVHISCKMIHSKDSWRNGTKWPWKKFLRRRFTRKGKSSIATTNLLAQKIWSNDFFKICYHAGGSTEHFPRPKMKRRNEESPPSDTSTPKKRKPRLAGEIRTYLLTCPLTLTPPQPHLLSPCLCIIKMLGSSKMTWIVTIRTHYSLSPISLILQFNNNSAKFGKATKLSKNFSVLP